MANEIPKYIPVMTSNDTDMPLPIANSDGQLIIGASALELEPNQLVLFDSTTETTTQINPYTVAPDYYVKAKQYEYTWNVIEQQKQEQASLASMFSDSTNPTQINSVADVLFAGNSDYHPFKSINTFTTELFEGNTKQAFSDLYQGSTANLLVDKATALVDLTFNRTLRPWFTPELSIGDKTAYTLNNALVNLSETLDTVTGANIVKGFAQGLMDGGMDQAVKNVKAGFGDPTTTGRTTFDWNLKPYNEETFLGSANNTLFNFALEVVSDPTSWITFGTSAVMKQSAKNAFTGVVAGAADDIGLVLSKADVDSFTNSIAKAYMRGGDFFSATKNSPVLQNIKALDPEDQYKFFTSLKAKSNVAIENSNLHLLGSINNTVDMIQRGALKSVAMTSAPGYYFLDGVLKGARHLGSDAYAYMMSKLNRIKNKVGLEPTIVDLDKVERVVYEEAKTFQEVVKLNKEFPDAIVRATSESIQKRTLSDISIILYSSNSDKVILRQLDKYVTDTLHMKDIATYVNYMRTNPKITSEALRRNTQEVINRIQTVVAEDKYRVLRAASNSVALDRLDAMDPYEIKNSIRDMHDLETRGLLPDTITKEILQKYTEGANSIALLKHSDMLGAALKGADSEGMDYVIDEIVRIDNSVFDNVMRTGIINPTLQEAVRAQIMTKLDEVSLNYHDVEVLYMRVLMLPMVIEELFDKKLLQAVSQHITEGKSALHTYRPLRDFPVEVQELYLRIAYARIQNIRFRKTREAQLRQLIQANTGTITHMHNEIERAMETIKSSLEPSVAIKFNTDRIVGNIEADVVKKLHSTGVGKNEYPTLISEALIQRIRVRPEDVMFSISMFNTPVYQQIATNALVQVKEIIETLYDPTSRFSELAYNLDTLLSDVDYGMFLGDVTQLKIPINDLKSIDRALRTLLEDSSMQMEYAETGIPKKVPDRGGFTSLKREIQTVSPPGKYKKIVTPAIRESFNSILEEAQAVADPGMFLFIRRVESTVNILEDAIEFAMREAENIAAGQMLKPTAEAMRSRIYELKLSNIKNIDMLLSNEAVTQFFMEVYTGTGIGGILEVIKATNAPGFNQDIVREVQGMAHSVYTAQYAINLVRSSKVLHTNWQDGLLDTLATTARRHVSEINNPVWQAKEWLYASKRFIEKSRMNIYTDHYNHVVPVLGDTKSAALNLYEKLNSDADNNLVWHTARQAYQKDKEKYYDVIYYANVTGTDYGDIFDITFVAPDGQTMRFIHRPVAEHFAATVTDAEARALYGGADVKDLATAIRSSFRLASPDTIVSENVADFATKIHNVFQSIKDSAMGLELSPRLVGFDTSPDTRNTDEALSNFAARHRLNTRVGTPLDTNLGYYSINSLDVGQPVRTELLGSMPVTLEVKQEFERIAKSISDYLDSANVDANSTHEMSTIIPDFSTRYMADLRMLRGIIGETLDNFVKVYSSTPNEVNYTATSKELLDVLLRATTTEALFSAQSTIDNALQALGETFANIRDTDTALSEDIIIMDKFQQLAGTANITYFINNHLVSGAGTSAIGSSKLYDPTIYAKWRGGLPTNYNSYESLFRDYVQVKRLETKLGYVKQPMLLYNRVGSVEETKKYMMGLMSALRTLIPSTQVSKHTRFYDMIPFDIMKNYTVEQLYVLTTDVMQNAMRVMESEKFSNHPTLEWYRQSDLFYYVMSPYKSVMGYARAQYTPGVPVLRTKRLDEAVIDNVNTRKAYEVLEMIERASYTQTMSDALELETSLRELNGMVLPNFKTKEGLIKSMHQLVDGIKHDIIMAEGYALDRLNNLPEDEFNTLKDYDERVGVIMEQLEALETTVRNDLILSMDPHDYQIYLYKYANGIQVFDLETLSPAMAPFLKKIEYFRNINTYVDDVNKHLWIYLGDVKNLDHLVKRAEEFTLPRIDLNTLDIDLGTKIGRDYRAVVKELDAFTRGEYLYSTQRPRSETKYEELIANLPQEIQARLIPKEHFEMHDMLDTGMFHSIVGPYGYGAGTLINQMSVNPISNLIASYNYAIKQANTQDTYASMLFAEDNTLSLALQRAYSLSSTTITPTKQMVKELQETLKRNNKIVVGMIEGRLTIIPIKTENDIVRAVKHNAVITDYLTWQRSVEILEDNKIHSSLLKALNTPLRALKIGMLLTPGFLVRNIFDSALKGWVQSGMDLGFLEYLVKEVPALVELYDKTYAKLFTDTDAHMTKDNIAKIYAEKDMSQYMDQDTFNDMLSFYTNSVSSPTTKQLELLNNTAYNLYQHVKGNENINISMVEEAITLFREGRSNKEVYDTLKEKLGYHPEVVKDLIRLRKYMPKEEFKQNLFDKFINNFCVTKFIMEKNNDVESYMRAGVFLYQRNYLGKSLSGSMESVADSQFNRSTDTKEQRILEMAMPFSSFNFDNFKFWTEAGFKYKGAVISTINHALNAWYDPETFDPDEMVRNRSLQYLLLSGNLTLDEATGLHLKTGPSLFSALQLMTNPLDYLSSAWNVPIQRLQWLFEAMGADEDAYSEDPYNNTKPLSAYALEEYPEEILPLIPLIGALYQRMTSAYKNADLIDNLLPMVFPSLLGVTKTDAAGHTYQSRPVGYNWYSQSEEYRKTHRYVFGVSYVPAFMEKDPTTYINTYQRLLNMGYPQETVVYMMQNGWYMKYDKGLQLYQEGQYDYTRQKKTYHSRTYADRTYAKKAYTDRAYAKKSYPITKTAPKAKKAYRTKYDNEFSRLIVSRMRNGGIRVRRIERARMYTNLYTKTGVPRENLIHWRGANRSSRQLLVDRWHSNKMKHRRIRRQIRAR